MANSIRMMTANSNLFVIRLSRQKFTISGCTTFTHLKMQISESFICTLYSRAIL